MSWRNKSTVTRHKTKSEFEHPVLVEVLSRLNGDFANGLYKQCMTGRENVFLSPFSISVALAMVLIGARGKTREQMTKVMCLNEIEGPTAIYSTFQDVIHSIGKATQTGLELVTVNRLYIQKDIDVLPKYKILLKKHFNTKIYDVDFFSKPDKVRKQINHLVEKVTNNRIKDLIADKVINKNTHFILVNAIYFKGNWDDPFDVKDTSQKSFKVSKKEEIMVDMMYDSRYVRYCESKKLRCQMVELPYTGQRLAMYFLLPSDTDGLDDLEASLNYNGFHEILDSSENQKVKISIPRFKIESSFELNAALDTMGMKDLFISAKADLSGITIAADSLYVSAVVHKAFLEVNEKGTEAAAATGVMGSNFALVTTTLCFVCDHPFLVLIRDNLTDLILFMGRVVRPTQ